jgi:hypothetical protein
MIKWPLMTAAHTPMSRKGCFDLFHLTGTTSISVPCFSNGSDKATRKLHKNVAKTIKKPFFLLFWV